jgi:very-short-patch-repair endonuclease
MAFDLLIIDEASQMKPEDALGGLLRAKQAIVVGDPHQLPPTDFFARAAPVDDTATVTEDDDPDDIDAESILDWSLKTYPAPRRLKWHYRSQCESLIAFSNKEFYASKSGSHGDLITFPSPKPGAFSVDLVRVNGNYKASRNPTEAARIVEAAIDFMIRHADLPPVDVPTVGIVAINIEQKEAIREEFNRSGRDDAVERYLSACNSGTPKRGPEPFFIKNLENVQGDERDIILISLTYGPEPGQTRVMQRFGPIARTQGHRRLNVLFTRARRRVVVFSSMGSDDVIVTPTSRRGVRVLRDYLRYTESRRLEVGEASGREVDSDFEREVKSRLEGHDFIVDPQVGVAGYRIDLGVRHPKHPTVYLAGIECDGAAFHSAKSARDRDRLRESVLRGLGWDILRIWSTDWFTDANLQTDRIVNELRRLAERPIVPDSSWVVIPDDVGSPDKAFATSIHQGLGADLSETDGVTQPDELINGAAIRPEIALSDVRIGKAAPSDGEVRSALLRFRDDVIFQKFPGAEPERCILRDLMIDKILEAHLDEPADFVTKIPLWLRERTDQRQAQFLEEICAIVERLQ